MTNDMIGGDAGLFYPTKILLLSEKRKETVMASQNHGKMSPEDKQKQKSKKPDHAAKQGSKQIPSAGLADGLINSGGHSTVQTQADQLNDTRFQNVQRQRIASQIGQVGGNQHLQRVIGQTKQSSYDPLAKTTQPSQAVQLKELDAALVQRIGEPLDKDEKVTPAHGEDEGEQRRYSVEQYISMWEAEQGEKLTPKEKETVARGCIGITALNLSGGGNPPLDRCYDTFEKAKSLVDKANALNEWLRSIPLLGMFIKKKKFVLFAKMFWSNQDPDADKRKTPDDKAFRPDKSGKVDMSDYEYRARPGFINFDYAFWDEASQSFWHANHSEPGMEVYQSTKERFEEGYEDFDRTIYCVAVAENYDPEKAAAAH